MRRTVALYRYVIGILLFYVIYNLSRKNGSNILSVSEKIEVSTKDNSASNIRIVCVILTQKKNHKTRVRAIADTWGKRCKALVFVTNSTLHMHDQNIVDTGKNDTYNTIWGKVKTALRDSYERYKNEADWFIKADDDSFAVVENIKYFIESKKIKPSDPTWFGSQYHLFSKHGYMAGGGYVMSLEAVRRFVEIGLNRTNNEGCKAHDDTGAEDAEMGKCMSTVGVVPIDSRDTYGRSRNFPFNVEYVVGPAIPDNKFWYWKNIKYPQIFGHPGCCSDTSSLFHYVTVNEMYKYEYLIYNSFVHEESPQRAPPPPASLVRNMKIDWKSIQA
ncbi:glycoprotein-N-acetylgalactosamine 3-beta-galactosyltransferase 1 isoform X1 [Lepeophtheirus salmonis]|uniref:glycoprotein-N-acetylgalactosamine 3-beta-galactosyltransferase 1 isoform X1 n=1 Tax=Lepeophtheirus salmonis TaxID=72036 RepID=UPI001AEAB92F|nr:glycoprotein-N-acetylgalactosamine 3-beta-galactosyltransferase 1-like isoform X1 [Lepeophtheirus salmonis]